MVQDGATWCNMVQHGATWFKLVKAGATYNLGMTWALLWQNLASLWHTLAYSGTLWHTLSYSGILWHNLVYSGILWHTLAYTGISNASLETADGAYHCPVGSIWLFLAPSGALIAIPTY